MARPITQISREVDARNMARLAAVQALYQMEHSSAGVDSVVREFEEFRLGGELDGVAIRHADSDFFRELVCGVVDLQHKVDPFIDRFLTDGWSLKRINSTARAILRCSFFELVKRPDIPARVVIDQYIELSDSFFEENSDETAFINALLDKAAREVRQEELNSGSSSSS